MTTGRFFYGYKLVAAAFLAQFIAIGIYSYVLGPFMQPMINDLGWSRADYTHSINFSDCDGYSRHINRRTGRQIRWSTDNADRRHHTNHRSHRSCMISSLLSWWLLNGVLLTVGTAMVGSLVVNVTLSKWFIVNRGKIIAFAAMGVLFWRNHSDTLDYLPNRLGWRIAWVYLGISLQQSSTRLL